MAKPKFELTTDLVKVEKEAITELSNNPEPVSRPVKRIIEREQFGLKISKDVKKHFQRWCFENEVSMTEALENALKKFIGYK